MKIARIKVNSQTRYGVVEGKHITLMKGGLFDPLDLTKEKLPIEDAKFLIPLEPKTFYAAGLNYAQHAIEHAKANDQAPNIPSEPHIGYRANNALVAHGEPIIKPKDSSEEFQYEGELVAIIGRRTKNVAVENALDYVFGYTIGNDVSERTWQRKDRTLWRAKNTDTFKPMGPWIETEVELNNLVTTVRVNDREVISFQTNNMIFGVQKFISAMSKYLTLIPGDMIWMGTEGHSKNLSQGDVCDISISGIGTLSNPVVAGV